jgi:zinc protease
MTRLPTSARSAFHALAVFALLGAAPARAAAPDYVAPRPVERTLDNGLRIVVFEDARLPIAQIQLFVPAGVIAEPEKQPGIAHLAGQMLRRGTPTRDAARFASEMSALGAELTVTVLRDYAVASAGFLSADLEAGLDLVADAVMHPLFSNEEVGRVRYEVSRTLIDLHLNGVTTAEEQIWPAALAGHPYGRPPVGTVAEIGLRDRDELKAFHESRYRPGGSVLAVAGDVRAERVFELARRAFSGWSGRAPSAPSIMVGPGSLRPAVRIVDLPTGGRTELRIASGAPERGSPEHAAFLIANGVFSDAPGSRLARGAGRPGVLGTPVSTYTALRDAGLFVLRASARTDSAGAAVAALRAAIAELAADPPSAAEVEAAVALRRDTWPIGFSTLAGLLGGWGDADAYGLAEEALRGYAGALDTLDAGGVGRAVARWIDPARLSILAVGPAETLQPQLEAFGEVEVIRIDDSPQAAWATREPTAEDLTRGREIVEQGVRAHGGLAALRAMKDSSIDATVVINAQGRDVNGRLRQARREPFRFRETMNVFVYENEQVLVGDVGWVYDTQSGRVQPADSMQIATMRSSFRSDLPHQLLMATEPGAVAIDRGEETLEGRKTNVVEVRLQSEERQLWLLFDAATHELVASDVRGGIPPRVLARRTFSDFRKVKDLRLPFEEARYVQNVLVMRIQVNEMGYNIGIGDEMFGVPITRD